MGSPALTVPRREEYAQVVENRSNNRCLLAPGTPNRRLHPPIGGVGSPRPSSNAAPTTTRLFWD